jgi:hypothetical protein
VPTIQAIASTPSAPAVVGVVGALICLITTFVIMLPEQLNRQQVYQSARRDTVSVSEGFVQCLCSCMRRCN